MVAPIEMKAKSAHPSAERRNALDPHAAERIDLAAAFRWTARLGMHESIANHFSLAVSPDGKQFLMNPKNRHFSRIRASEIRLYDAAAADAEAQAESADPTAWAIHGAIHRNVPEARCVLHVHPKYATVVASLSDSAIHPIDQNTMRFYGRVAVDAGFDGMGLGEEAERLSQLAREKPVVMLGNHGVMVVGATVAQAFDELYYLERACETLVTAYMTGKPLRLTSPAVAAKTAEQWLAYLGTGFAEAHFAELKGMLDEDEPDYRD